MTSTLDGTHMAITDAAAFIAELDLDLAERAARMADAIAKGRLHDSEAEHVTRLIGDIRADLLHAFAPLADGELRGNFNRERPDFTWNNKVTWIRGELAELEANAPDAVAKGRMTSDQAKRRLAAFRLLIRLYWRDMFMWLPPPGPALDYLQDRHGQALAGVGGAKLREHMASIGGKMFRQYVREHMAVLEAENGQQGVLAA